LVHNRACISYIIIECMIELHGVWVLVNHHVGLLSVTLSYFGCDVSIYFRLRRAHKEDLKNAAFSFSAQRMLFSVPTYSSHVTTEKALSSLS
jgi:hypothetical protein